MSRCLSQDLIKYQSAEEEKILSLADGLAEADKNLVRELYEPLKITIDDLSREYSAADVRQLCLRTKVRVNMTLFNCVWDAKKRLDKKGRLSNRSDRFVNAMLIKAVHKKMVFPYTPDEIAKCNHIRQCQLKKENNARLDRWSLESEPSPVVGYSNVDPSLLLAQIPNEILPNSIKESAANLIFPASIVTESQESSLTMPSSEPELWIDENSGETDDDEDADAADTDINPEPAGREDALMCKDQSDKSLASIPDWAQAAADINTESMTLETLDVDMQTPQTDSQPLTNIAEDYIVFGTQVPSTSTQTQNTEPFI